MKKLLITVLAVALMAGSAWAVDIQVYGDAAVRGQVIVNDPGYNDIDFDRTDLDSSERPARNVVSPPDNPSNFDNNDNWSVDQDLNVWVKFNIDDNTFITTRTAIHDETWTSRTDSYRSADNRDADISVERAWLGYTFQATNTKLEAGLQTGNAWGTAFGDGAGARYRFKVTQPVGNVSLIGVYEKAAEEGFGIFANDAEDDDGQSVFAAAVIPIGENFKLMPLLAYATRSDAVLDRDDDGVNIIRGIIAATGQFGSFNFEAEFDYQDYDVDTVKAADADQLVNARGRDLLGAEVDSNGDLGDDYDFFGAYAKGWFTMNAWTFGGWFAYSSYDEDSGRSFDFGDDFDSSLFLGDWVGGVDYEGADFAGYTAASIFVDWNVTEALSLGTSFVYYWSNIEDEDDIFPELKLISGKDQIYEEAEAWEFGLTGAYKITDAVTYSAAFGYGSIDLEDSILGDDPDEGMRLYHRLAMTF